MNFQKDYELAQILCSRGQEDQISNLVDPKNLSQIMNLLNIELVEPSSVSKKIMMKNCQ